MNCFLPAADLLCSGRRSDIRSTSSCRSLMTWLDDLKRGGRRFWNRSSFRTKRRAKRIQDHAGDIKLKQLDCVSRIQRVFRARFYRFERKVLIDRLKLEVAFATTGVGLVLFSLLFVSFSFFLLSIFDSVAVVPVYNELSIPSAVAAANAAAIPVISSMWLSVSDPQSLPQSTGVTISGFVLGSTVPTDIIGGDCMTLSLSQLTLGNRDIPLSLPGDSGWTHVAVVANDSSVEVLWDGSVVAASATTPQEHNCLYKSIKLLAASSVSRDFGVFGIKASANEIQQYFMQFGLPRIMVLSGSLPPTYLVESTNSLPGFVYVGGGGVVELADGAVARAVFPSQSNLDPASRLLQPVVTIDKGIPTLTIGELRVSVTETKASVRVVRTPPDRSFTAWFVVIVLLSIFGVWWVPKRVSVDLAVLLFALAYAVALFVFMVDAETARDDLMKALTESLDDVSRFSSASEAVIARCSAQQTYLHVGTMLVLYPLIWRMLAYTRMHPRIGLLANTLTESVSEVLHYLVSFFVVTLGLAIVGVLTLSRTAEVYTTVSGSYWELFQIMLGDDWNDVGWEWRASPLGVLYFVLVPVLCIFTLLNFLLAVILDTYVKVRKRTLESATTTHSSILADLAAVVQSSFLFWAFELPPRRVLIKALTRMSTRVVTVAQLERVFASCRKNKISRNVIKFCQFYHSFSFLKETSGLRNKQYYDEIARNSRATRRLIDAKAHDAESQFRVVAEQLKRMLVEMQMRTADGNARDRVAQEYKVARHVDMLIKEQIQSRLLAEYHEKAEVDAAIIRSLSPSRGFSRANIFQSFLMEEREETLPPTRHNRSLVYSD